MTKLLDISLPSQEVLDSIRPGLRSPSGKKILRSIFYDAMSYSAVEAFGEPYFTLKDHNVQKDFVKEDGTVVPKTYWSMKNIYMSYDHVPGYEYEFAQDVFGSWDHWVSLTNSGIVRDHIASWREELTIKLQAKAMKAIMLTAAYEGSKGTPAAKYIADRGWEVKRGRPSNAEVEKEKKLQASVSQQVSEDMERLGMFVVNGGKGK